MAERELTRQREAEARPIDYYEVLFQESAALQERGRSGKIVLRGKETPWEQNRQSLIKNFLYPAMPEPAVTNWMMFVHDIKTHSGRHRHQGGLAIFVLEGKGWTTVDGVRHDWEEGDLILLPVMPTGVEHQHFNAVPGSPCKWLALIYRPFLDCMGNPLEQTEQHPDYKQA